jgi:hypothetical protein
MALAWSITLCGGIGSLTMAGLPARRMPAFSKPMLSRSGPRYSMWSRSMLVMTAQSASMMLTASSRPPRPTSRIATSGFSSIMQCRMPSVVNSK